MKGDPVAFGVYKKSHVAVIFRDLLLGLQYAAPGCNYPVKAFLYIGAAEIDQHAF